MTIKGMVIFAMFFGCRVSGEKNGIFGGRLKPVSTFHLLSEYRFKRFERVLRKGIETAATDCQSVAAPCALAEVNILCAQRARRKRRITL